PDDRAAILAGITDRLSQFTDRITLRLTPNPFPTRAWAVSLDKSTLRTRIELDDDAPAGARSFTDYINDSWAYLNDELQAKKQAVVIGARITTDTRGYKSKSDLMDLFSPDPLDYNRGTKEKHRVALRKVQTVLTGSPTWAPDARRRK